MLSNMWKTSRRSEDELEPWIRLEEIDKSGKI